MMNSSASGADRSDIKNLYVVPNDSSRTRDMVKKTRPQIIWKNKPTPITTDGSNPFSGMTSFSGVKSGDETRGGRGGRESTGRSSNQTARQTLLNAGGKQIKFGISKTTGKKRAGSPVLIPPDAEVIDLDRPSTDDLDIAEASSKYRASYKPSAVTSTTVQRPLLANDGEDTIWAERKFMDDESDPIEQYPSSDVTGKNHMGPGVKQMVARYDVLSQPEIRIDLAAKLTKKANGSNLKEKMKPKVPKRALLFGRPSGSDPTTSSTPFTSNQTNKRKRDEAGLQNALPVKCQRFGVRLKEEPGQMITWKGGRDKGELCFLIACSPNAVGKPETSIKNLMGPMDPRSHCKSFMYTRNSRSLNYPIIGLKTFNPTRGYSHSFGKDFKMGDKRRGDIYIMFDVGHDLWSSDKYDDFIKWMKGTINENEVLDDSGAKAVWEAVMRDLELHATQESADKIPTSRERNRLPHASSRKGSESGDFATLSEKSSSVAPGGTATCNSAKPKSSERSLSLGLQGKSTDTGPVNLRRSLRHSAPAKPSFDLDPDEVILIYPQGIPGAVNITYADVNRLEPGEFLNDTLIEFGLKLWLRDLEEREPDLAKQIHVFSSFFYKKLNKKNIEEGYNSVRKWTSKFDLFQKKYIVVPINEHMHWYLAIIYEPEHILHPSDPPSPHTRLQSRSTAKSDETRERVSRLQETLSPHFSKSNEPPTSSELEVEEDLNDFTKACSISTHTSSTTGDDLPMEVDASTTPSGRPSSGLSYVDAPMDTDAHNEVQTDILPSRAGSTSPSNRLSDNLHPSSMAPVLDSHRSPEGDADILNITEDSFAKSSAIDPSRFYSEPSSRDLSKSRAALVPRPLSPLELEADDEEFEFGPSGTPRRTCIFTLDSLGSAHPQAIRQLSKYLKLEAKDKKAFNSNVKIDGRQASVPTQPNFCDCGVYLLHLAQTFLSEPLFYYEKSFATKKTVSNEIRQADWHDEKVSGMREYLNSRIQELSEQWQHDRLEKGKAKKDDEEKDGAVVMGLSDSDIDIVEYPTLPPKPKPKLKPPSSKGRVSRNR